MSQKRVAWIEIHTGLLVCDCGHKTLVPRVSPGETVASMPKQRCRGCGKLWWAPAAADCEEVST